MSLRPSSPMRLAAALAAAAWLAGCGASALRVAGVPGATGGAAAAAAAGRTLFAIYTIGGDLEDDVDPEDGQPDEATSGQLQPKGANSDDLREIVAGLQAMTPERRARVDVFVMMGGARKRGWTGMRALDGEALVRDAADGYFGNLPERDYLARDPRASMADPRTLRRFFEMTRARAAGHGTVLVELAGHGASYYGMGADTTQPEEGQWVGLPAIEKALAGSGLRGDVIAFPACMMASLEVARAIGPRFRYMVGSEETMPGEGWNYQTVFGQLGHAPARPAATIARTYADSLVDDPAHQYTDYKTCSAVDLTKVGPVLAALDAWAAHVDPADAAARTAVVETARARKGFGLDAPTDPAVSLDVADYFTALAARAPAQRAAATRVAAAARAAVLHHRGDRGYDHALGVSFYPPHVRSTTGADASYAADVAATPAFGRLITGLRPFLPDAARPRLGQRLRHSLKRP